MVQTGATQSAKDDFGADDIFGEQESEDKAIMKSIEYAENKLSTKMGSPEVMPKENPNAPVKYDVEDVDMKISSTHLSGVTSKTAEDLGDCDMKDDACIADQQSVMKASLKLVEPK